MIRRVGLVIGQLTRGGAEGQLFQVACGLDRQRFRPFVYSLTPAIDPYGPRLAEAGVPVRVLRGSGPQRLFALAAALRRDGIDVIHSWLFLANAAAGLASLACPGRALVTSARNRKRHGRANRWANLLAFRRSGAIVVNSADVADYIVEHYRAPRSRIRVVVNGVDMDRFHPRSGGAEAPPRIVTVGRVVEQKNQALFLSAAARLAVDFPTLRFVLVGDGPLRPGLEKRAAELGLSSRVDWLGERDDVETVLRGATLFWLTSRWEGMPNAVLEAMACGVPAVATDVGGARELIEEGVSGFVVENGDEEGIVARSRELLSDPARWQTMAAAALARAGEFSRRRMIERMEELYEEVGR